MVGPRCSLLTHPADGLDYLDVGDLDGSVENRLMVGNPIPKTSQSIETRVNDFAGFSAAS
jgi:hypothetical protein